MQRAKQPRRQRVSVVLGDAPKPRLPKPKSAFKQFCSETFRNSSVFVAKAELKQKWEALDEATKQQLMEAQTAKRKAYNELVWELRKEKSLKESLALTTSKIELLTVQLASDHSSEIPQKKPTSAFKTFRAQELMASKEKYPNMTRRERRAAVRKAWSGLGAEERQRHVEGSRSGN